MILARSAVRRSSGKGATIALQCLRESEVQEPGAGKTKSPDPTKPDGLTRYNLWKLSGRRHHNGFNPRFHSR